MRSSQALILATVALGACQTQPARQAPDAAVTTNVAPARDLRATQPAATVGSTQPPSLPEPAATTEALTLVTPAECAVADWSARTLPPLLRPGKKATPSELDRAGSAQLVFDTECTDAPAGAAPGSP